MRKTIAMFFVLFCATAGYGQFADVSTAGGPVAISAAWRFQTGDDPQWASPNFDDSRWALMRLDKSWAEQGYKGYYGYSWYRMKIKLPAGKAPLALGVVQINSADEFYADGQLISSIGKMRPAPVWLGYNPCVRVIALAAALNGRTIELAIRVWQPQASSNDTAFIGRAPFPLIGPAPTIASLHEISVMRFATSNVPSWFLCVIEAGIGMFSLGLFFLRRRATEYLWAALFLLDSAALGSGEWFYRTLQWPAFDWILGADCLGMGALIFWLLFIWRFLGVPSDKLLRAGIAILLLVPIPTLLSRFGFVSLTNSDLTWAIVPLALIILVCARLVRLAWQGNREAQLLLIPFLLSNLMQTIAEAVDFLYWVGAIKARRGYTFLAFYRGPAFSLTWGWLFELLSDVAIAVLLMRRFTHSAERDERLSAEMEAAQRVQEQLIPAQLPVTPNFALDAVYAAAGEVGGDFYQVFPQSDGGVLVAIGDVSGKGLKAAMLGSQVVGALRSLAQESSHPARILERLNQQLAASADGGFVTCCVARIGGDGLLTLANAGHLAPYRNGVELATESGFPLGIIAGVSYADSSVTLEAGDRLTFMSDGVVEARSASGELFGFERTCTLSTQSAKSIAQAAQEFGQEDDITVLTLTRLAPAPVPAAKASSAPVPAPA